MEELIPWRTKLNYDDDLNIVTPHRETPLYPYPPLQISSSNETRFELPKCVLSILYEICIHSSLCTVELTLARFLSLLIH